MDLPVGHVRQTGENIPQIGIRIDSASAAAFNDRVNDGSPFSGIGFADEQPVLLPDGGWSDGVFHEVVVDLNAAIIQEHLQ